jgi:hypothetical protein
MRTCLPEDITVKSMIRIRTKDLILGIMVDVGVVGVSEIRMGRF